MTDEAAFWKFLGSSAGIKATVQLRNCEITESDFAQVIWQAAISYMKEQSEPVAEVKLDYHGMKDIVFNAHHWTHILNVGDKLYTTPQYKQPLKRLRVDKIDELMRGDNGFCSEEFANVIIDAMLELNK